MTAVSDHLKKLFYFKFHISYILYIFTQNILTWKLRCTKERASTLGAILLRHSPCCHISISCSKMKDKFIIYEMLPRIFGNRKSANVPNGSLAVNGTGKFGDIDAGVLDEIAKLHVSHIWFAGVIRHATAGEEGVKGGAGSPYAISDYYDVNPYLASRPAHRMKEFEKLISRTNRAGMGVIMDFVPNHVSRNYHSETANFDERNYYPGKIFDGDWSDTAKLDYSNSDTREKMKEILLFWASKGIAGFRCDMIELVPIDFWEWCIPLVKKACPNLIFIGEAYKPENYKDLFERGGFDYLYDKSGFYDTLKRIVRGGESASAITREWQKLGGFQHKMLNFLENHDEERLTSPYFAGDAFKGLAALFVSLFFNDAPFMIYAGQEFGEGPEKTSIFDFTSLPTLRNWLKGVKSGKPMKYLGYESKDLYRIYRRFFKLAVKDPVLRKGETFDLQYANPRGEHYNPDFHFSFLRHYGKKTYLCVANFTDEPAVLSINIPKHAFDYLGIEESSDLNSSVPVTVEVAPNAGSLLRIR